MLLLLLPTRSRKTQKNFKVTYIPLYNSIKIKLVEVNYIEY
jgi:hypothetical protein